MQTASVENTLPLRSTAVTACLASSVKADTPAPNPAAVVEASNTTLLVGLVRPLMRADLCLRQGAIRADDAHLVCETALWMLTGRMGGLEQDRHVQGEVMERWKSAKKRDAVVAVGIVGTRWRYRDMVQCRCEREGKEIGDTRLKKRFDKVLQTVS